MVIPPSGVYFDFKKQAASAISDIVFYLCEKINLDEIERNAEEMRKERMQHYDRVRNTWSKRIDLELQQQLNNNIIGSEEFGRRWTALFWKNTQDKSIDAFLDKIYSLVDTLGLAVREGDRSSIERHRKDLGELAVGLVSVACS